MDNTTKIIGSKLPPETLKRTYFSSGRAAFAYLLSEVLPQVPHTVYLPSYMCWSLVSTMRDRFPDVKVVYYPVDRKLRCTYPAAVGEHEVLVFVHYFGHRNSTPLPPCQGVTLEDVSHSHFSPIQQTGTHVFGSLRKIVKVADGGFVAGPFLNPHYEPSRKLDTWLRYQAKDWRDVREAENMIDRDWQIADMSSQSLAVLFTHNPEQVRRARHNNEKFLAVRVKAGHPLFRYRWMECPLTHNRLFATSEERDDLRAFLAKEKIFCSIHWPLHEDIKRFADEGGDIGDAEWLADHILCIPVSHDYTLDDMKRIADAIERWKG